MPKMQMWDMRNPFKYGFDPNNYGWIVPLVGIVDQMEEEEEPLEPEPSKPKPSKPEPSKPEPKPAPPPITAPSKPSEPNPAPPPSTAPIKPPAPPITAPSLPPITRPTATSMAVVEAERLLREAQEAEARARKKEEEEKNIAEEKQKISDAVLKKVEADQLRIEEENRKAEAAQKIIEELQAKEEADRLENERKLQEYLTARQQAADARKLAEINAAEEERKRKLAEANRLRQLELEKEKKDDAERTRLHEFALQRLLAEEEQKKKAQEAAVLAQEQARLAQEKADAATLEELKREEELKRAQEQAAAEQAAAEQAVAEQAERDRMANIHKLKPEPSSTFTGSIADMHAQMEEREKHIKKQNEMSGENLKNPSLARENWEPGTVEKVKLPPRVLPKPTREKAAAVAAEQKRLSDERLREAQLRDIERNRAAKGLPKFDPNSKYNALPDLNPKKGGTRRIKHKETKNHKVYRKRTKRRVPKYTRKLAVYKLAHIRLPHVSLPCIS